MEVEIRVAREPEYEQLGHLVEDAWRADGLFSPETEFYGAVLRDVAARAAVATVLVAVGDDGEPVGCITLVADGGPMSDIAGPGEAEIRMLGVAPAARGRGVGTALTSECLRRARAAGCGRVVLSTRAEMAAAQRIYARLGFDRMPQHDWQPLPGVHLLAYACNLRG
jgi:ribosomal protein S18 acetylase RimI-like enzyme